MLAREIGQAVAAARERAGVSLEQLAESTSLDPVFLRSIESGDALPSTAKLDRIASTLGLDAFALYAGRGVERSLVVLPRHAARGDFQFQDLTVLRHALERATALRQVSAILGQSPTMFEPRAPGAEPAQDGYHWARRVRAALRNVAKPLDDLPRILAETFHVPVLAVPLATTGLMAAAVRSSASRSGAVVLNTNVRGGPAQGTNQAWLVDRVSMCHELCHVLLDEPRDGAFDVILDDPPRAGQDKSPIEQRAGAFAAELLIPLHGLRELFGDEERQVAILGTADKMVDEVRTYFRTPAELAVNHLYNYRYVAQIQDFREELLARARAREITTPGSFGTGDGVDPWRSVLVARTRTAHNEGLVTDGSARALLELAAGEPLPWETEST